MEITVRNATTSDLPSILELVKSVNRMVSSDEIQSWMLKDPQGLFLAEISGETDARKKLAGICCGTILDSDLGFMGLYMVREDIRGKSIGSKLWKTTKEHVGNRNIGVCGKVHNFEKYREKEGFVHMQDYVIKYYECFGDFLATSVAWPSDINVVTFFEGKLSSYRINRDKVILVNSSNELCQMSGRKIEVESIGSVRNEDEKAGKCVPSEKRCNGKAETSKPLNERLPENSVLKSVDCPEDKTIASSINEARSNDIHVQNMTTTTTNQRIDIRGTYLSAEEIISEVVEYDRSLHSRDRSVEVRQTFAWSSCKSSVALVAERVVGYGCLRPVLTGHWIISPLYADSEAIAEVILFDLLQGFDFVKVPLGVVIRLPDKNISAERLVHKFGFKEIENEIISIGFNKRCVYRDIFKIYSFHSTVFCCE